MRMAILRLVCLAVAMILVAEATVRPGSDFWSFALAGVALAVFLISLDD